MMDVIGARRSQRVTEVGRCEVGGHYASERYYKVNFCSYVAFGTLEFRQHSGTIEFEKMMNWVKITHMIIERANMRADIRPYRENNYDLVQKFTKFNAEIGITNTEVSDYMRRRYIQLRREA